MEGDSTRFAGFFSSVELNLSRCDANDGLLRIDMFHLWSLAEQDLLSETVQYRLRDTGQGLNRVQAAPKTSRMMHAILHRAQKSVGSWVGSSVVHMGDHNVPNALMFIGTPPLASVLLSDSHVRIVQKT